MGIDHLGYRAKKVFLILGAPSPSHLELGKQLAHKLNISIIPINEVLTDELLTNSSLAQRIKNRLELGEILPNTLVLDLLKSKLAASKPETFLLLGYPRTIGQIKLLKSDRMFKESSIIGINFMPENPPYYSKELPKNVKLILEQHQEVCDYLFEHNHIINVKPDFRLSELVDRIVLSGNID
ncbi:nucleoside monophosphate kinase [bacterium SCSIO 12741]|nr:nucleoside monophosphate kinase [bacterium SCSIO 12741]